MKSARFTTTEVDKFLSKTKTQFSVAITPQPNGKTFRTSRYQVDDEIYCKEKVDEATKALFEASEVVVDLNDYTRETEADSRCLLLVIDLVAQRVEDISTEDCIAEGFVGTSDMTPKEQFAAYWNEKYNELPFDNNPWCWTYTILAALKD